MIDKDFIYIIEETEALDDILKNLATNGCKGKNKNINQEAIIQARRNIYKWIKKNIITKGREKNEKKKNSYNNIKH